MRPSIPILVVVLAIAPPRPLLAQCTSNTSSCVTCHETHGMRPVLQDTQPWHVDHGYGDLCAACHAGDPTAAEMAPAHRGLRSPLLDPSRACAGCHPSDAWARAERYQAVQHRATRRSPPPAPPAPPPPAQPSTLANRILAALAVLFSIALYLTARSELRRWRSAPRDHAVPARARLRAWLGASQWSPYATGTMLGLVVGYSEVFCGRPLAASGAFDRLAAWPGRWLFPTSQYYRHVMSPGITWQVWLIVGVLGGAFASSRLAGEARLRWLPDREWTPRFGAKPVVRLALAFFGAVLVQLGAGIAGGCTSGLAISGGAALSPGAFVFMAGMFAGGIPTAWLWYRGPGG